MKNKHSIWIWVWTIVFILSIIFMPNLDTLIQEKGQITLPDNIQSQQAEEILNRLNNDGKKVYELAIVFHDENGIADTQKEQIGTILAKLIEGNDKIVVTNSLVHTTSEEVAKQLISEDKTTILAQLSVEKQKYSISEITKMVDEFLQQSPVKTYITGADVVMNDFSNSAQEGVKKTEVFAVVIIIIILLAIFRSPIIPSISLTGVGISYIISLSIIALLVEHFNYPFSNFTQVFLVVVLFGIGTDYNILLFNRFKEELALNDVSTAVKNTYKHAGKTVLLAGSAVGVGFAALIFADFQLYKATSAIFIGVIILLAVLMTFNKFFMLWLGKRIFWPSKKELGHSESKYWAGLSTFAFKRPIITIVMLLIFTLPISLGYTNHLNFNDLEEVSDKYESKQAINIIDQHYSPGLSSPTTLVIEAQEDLVTQENLVYIDEITELITDIDGVDKVFSVTRPEGTKIEDLYLNDQSTVLDENINTITDGLQKLTDELSKASGSINSDKVNTGVGSLTDGTNELANGITTLTDAIKQLTDGSGKAATSGGDLKEGLDQIVEATNQIQTSLDDLSTNYTNIYQGYSQLDDIWNQLTTIIDANISAYEAIEDAMNTYIQTNPTAAQSEEIQTVLTVSKNTSAQLQSAKTELNGKKSDFQALNSYFQQANDGINALKDAQSQVNDGLSSVTDGVKELTDGLNVLSIGGAAIDSKTPQLTEGAQNLTEGQQQLAASLMQLSDLEDGLGEATKALSDISNGVGEINDYIQELGATHSSTFNIPKDVMEGEDFQKSVEMYMYDNNYTTTMRIILAVNPYTGEAMDIVEEIDEKLLDYLNSTPLKVSNGVLGGKSMQNVDLQQMSQNDFVKSAIVMIIGIGIILVIITRSGYQTLIILATLLLATYTSLGLTQLIVENVFPNNTLVGWNVPFFTFISLFSLGVDYSIFLMMRFKETKDLGSVGIIQASKQMGSVIFAAMFILSCTFAALIPSGNNSLIQVAIAVIIGLVVFAAILMPLAIPAALKLPDLFKPKK